MLTVRCTCTIPCVSILYFVLLLSEPTHERALSNLAYFEDIRASNPDKFIDAEMTPPPTGTDRLEPSEKEEYEALCREAKPLVSEMEVSKCA